MSFQAYLDSIRVRTGQTVADLRAYAVWQGWLDSGRLRPEVRAGTIATDMKRDFGLGHGHAMAVYALLTGILQEGG